MRASDLTRLKTPGAENARRDKTCAVFPTGPERTDPNHANSLPDLATLDEYVTIGPIPAVVRSRSQLFGMRAQAALRLISEGSRDSMLMQSLIRAFVSLLHPRMLALMIWPVALALALWIALAVAVLGPGGRRRRCDAARNAGGGVDVCRRAAGGDRRASGLDTARAAVRAAGASHRDDDHRRVRDADDGEPCRRARLSEACAQAGRGRGRQRVERIGSFAVVLRPGGGVAAVVAGAAPVARASRAAARLPQLPHVRL